MCDRAITHLCVAQATLNQHLASSNAATEEQLFKLNDKVNELRAQVDEVHQHRLTFHHGAVENTKVWKSLADQGMRMEAVREAQTVHGLGITDALQLVKAYQERKYAFAQVPPKQA